MSAARVEVWTVQLWQHGRYVRTLPEMFSRVAAEAFVAAWCGLGQRDGRQARLVSCTIAIPDPDRESAEGD